MRILFPFSSHYAGAKPVRRMKNKNNKKYVYSQNKSIWTIESILTWKISWLEYTQMKDSISSFKMTANKIQKTYFLRADATSCTILEARIASGWKCPYDMSIVTIIQNFKGDTNAIQNILAGKKKSKMKSKSIFRRKVRTLWKLKNCGQKNIGLMDTNSNSKRTTLSAKHVFFV